MSNCIEPMQIQLELNKEHILDQISKWLSTLAMRTLLAIAIQYGNILMLHRSQVCVLTKLVKVMSQQM